MTRRQCIAEPLESEEFRDVVGFEGLYSISNLGRVISHHRYKGLQPGRLLALYLDKDGYLKACLARSGSKIYRFVHYLVAAAFIGPRPLGMVVNHKDATEPATMKLNNRADNLEYVTNQQNADHASRNGLLATGDRHGSRVHPERLRRGDNHPSKLNPPYLPRGDAHYARQHPEKMARGIGHGMVKLSEETVRAIRSAAGLHRDIAAFYGVDRSTVGDIKTGRTWRHLR